MLKGDTVMGGMVYKKLFLDDMFVSGLREEDGRVYERYWDDAPEELIFDFYLQPGDIFKDGFQDQVQMEVKQKREVDVEGKSRQCMDMWAYMEGKEVIDGLVDYWIEGIGCMDGPHFPFWWEAIGSSSLLLSCYDGDECIFASDDLNQIVNIQTVIKKFSSDKLYDLQGRQLRHAPVKGVYIQDGKKRVVK